MTSSALRDVNQNLIHSDDSLMDMNTITTH